MRKFKNACLRLWRKIRPGLRGGKIVPHNERREAAELRNGGRLSWEKNGEASLKGRTTIPNQKNAGEPSNTKEGELTQDELSGTARGNNNTEPLELKEGTAAQDLDTPRGNIPQESVGAPVHKDNFPDPGDTDSSSNNAVDNTGAPTGSTVPYRTGQPLPQIDEILSLPAMGQVLPDATDLAAATSSSGVAVPVKDVLKTGTNLRSLGR